MLDRKSLELSLRERLAAIVQIHEHDDGVLMLETPFCFPDGDRYSIYLVESPNGEIRLSDYGHTLMHISYEYDVDALYDGSRGVLREQIVRECALEENDGEFSVSVSADDIADVLFTFAQALTRIYDLTFLSRNGTT